MPRYARKKSESGVFHIMLRGINKQDIFEEDEDRRRFLSTLERFKEMCKFNVYGYCLMSNHIHLLIKENEEPLSNVVKRICSSYVYWYNMKYERCGHLFQERYKSEVVENEGYLLTVLRYIHQNPVKAGICKSVKEYGWSSYNQYIKKPLLVDTQFVLNILSPDLKNAINLFVKHSNELNEDKCLELEERPRLQDEEVRMYLKNYGITNQTELQQMERSKRNEILRKLKATEGITIRQLSRVTGISKSVIDRV